MSDEPRFNVIEWDMMVSINSISVINLFSFHL